MKEIILYNTMSRKKEVFKAIKKNEAGLYTCGPTVYNYAHIGNLRTYIFEDILKRVLKYNGYKVKHVMNITDVGHLTGDRDMGEDKLEKGAKREGKSAWEIAKQYTDFFKEDIKSLNLLDPDIWCHVTEVIPEQIELIKILEKKGFTYLTGDGVYFDTAKFPEYNKLSHQKLEDLQEGARVEKNEEKRNPTDFALWKFSPKDSQRQMEWDSPWGVGFPGWHIECSAISLKFLSDQMDIHCGGIDHVDVHHTNEIAQSEAATGKKFFNYWMHVAFLNIKGGKKMAKSDDSFLTLEKAFSLRGLNPLVYKYSVLKSHYRKPMEYGEEIMDNSAKEFEHLYNQIKELGNKKGKIIKKYQEKFLQAINNDLNTPQAMAVALEVFKANNSNEDKLATILDFDQVLGLKMAEAIALDINSLPKNISQLFLAREEERKNKNWTKADELRKKIEDEGFLVEDISGGESRITKK